MEIIFGYVLALVVAENVVLAWIIYDLVRRARVLESATSTSGNVLRSYITRLVTVEKLATATSSTALLGRVDELSEAVAKLADTHRKFAGRMDRRYQLEQDAQPAVEEVTDPQWIALRRAQETPSVGNGSPGR